eukprot:scaffold18515_cov30-Attheya_sp.AAC.1
MAVLISTMATIEANHEKYKCDISTQIEADVILSTADLETRVETIDAKVALVESDMQQTDLDIDDLEAFKD